MTKLVILTAKERRRFDSPPLFTHDTRALYFSLTPEELNIVQTLRKPTNQVGFVLQLGYFKANGKFFSAEQFLPQDIEYVLKMLGINAGQVNFSTYQKKIPHDHRHRILTHLRWQPLEPTSKQQIIVYAAWLIERQLSTKQVFLSLIDFCWQNKIELPSYNILTLIITDSYNQFEQDITHVLARKLTPHHQDMLNQLINTENGEDPKLLRRSTLTLLKRINQSLRPTDIQENVEAFQILKKYFMVFKSVLDALKLSDQATEYFATWVQKSTTFQLSQFPNRNKLYLHVLCYIKHQFYCRHDALMDIFIKSVQMAKAGVDSQINRLEKANRPKRNKAIKQLTVSHKDSRALINKIADTLKSPILSESGKLTQIEQLINKYQTRQETVKENDIVELEQILENVSTDQIFLNALESMSLKLQRRASNIVKVMAFNRDTSNAHLIKAICHFQTSDGQVSQNAPLDFLAVDEQEAVQTEGKKHVSLYKILLFSHMAEGIKSGNLNLLYSYRYKSIQEYLIDQETWQSQRKFLLSSAGLEKFTDSQATMHLLKQQLDQKYQTVNERFINGENKHLQVEKDGHIKIATPKIDSDDTGYVSSLLSTSGFVPILQVLADVNRITEYTNAFKHFSVKHKKMKPQPEIIFAGIIGKGCNIGVNRIANISIGISEDILKNTVNWCFSLNNLQSANNKILSLTNRLLLANVYRHDLDQLHTGSDGRKVNVAVDSLLASYSFKYFGKGKGVTIYVFLDERQLLFHSTVISSSEREAAYVIDGLVQNEVVKSSIHSTDTHGFTETVFAATHFMDTAFAPRIKRIAEQTLYAFSAKQTYEKRGYKVLPSRIIDIRLIETHWDDLLRFMATIKLKHTQASQLFKRLSSYAKNHPLYRALKEFGRIIKSIFILTYFDDVELRQRIEKQLNKVELSNKFSKAVFFANNQEFQQGTKEEQAISTACKVLIQNAIVLWNYLCLSQLLANNTKSEERSRMLESIKKGSIMTWQHINLQGEYDFTKHATNDNLFDLKKILALKVA